ncbi:MAG TPA: NUDIX domain-containing protein [Pyrinomonadaceae bacterium]|nr:NUDIX domain-containing protein [Pyrinomonadaceae bacterium]
MRTEKQVSAGGVAFRKRGAKIYVALISVGNEPRWQLPKGLIGKNEPIETAAMREVREETGLETELVGPVDTVEYWYFSGSGGSRVRFHKFVHFFLLRYKSGKTSDHDHEVNEARWVEISRAEAMLAFASEKKIVARAREMIEEL